MTITLTPKESEDIFYSSICNALSYIGGYGLQLDYSTKAYDNAWKKVDSPCFEDVLMQMLRDGGELKLVDVEGDGEYTRSIGLAEIHERVCKTPFRHLSDELLDRGDATTSDVILQTVFFEEVVFG